jgi:hypothetical protein
MYIYAMYAAFMIPPSCPGLELDLALKSLTSGRSVEPIDRSKFATDAELHPRSSLWEVKPRIEAATRGSETLLKRGLSGEETPQGAE